MLLLVSLANSGVFKASYFRKAMKNIPISKLQKQLGGFSNSKHLKNMASKINLKRITPLDKVTRLAKDIANKSPFSNKMMGIKNPMDAMRLYSKGGDKFFKSANIITTKALRVDSKLITKVGKKFPSLPNIPKLSQEQMLNKFAGVMKATGSFGFKITKGLAQIAIKNPKSAVAGLMFGWFLSDPVGFKEQLDKFGGNIEAFAHEIGSLVSHVVVGGTSGFIDGVVTSASKFMTTRNIIILLLALLLVWLLWQFKSFIIHAIQNRQTSNSQRERKINNNKTKKRKGRF